MKINILAAALLTILTASTQAAEKPLRILLVNDDGCQSVGTTSLQEKLAAKMQLEGLNINKNAIQRIECGKRMVKDIELDVFAKIFHVSVDELMYGPKEDR